MPDKDGYDQIWESGENARFYLDKKDKLTIVCCDCGVAHILNLSVNNRGIHIMIKKDEKETDRMRRNNKVEYKRRLKEAKLRRT